MASLNKVFLLGNLTRDPDLRGFSNGQNVCDLGLAVSRRFMSNGQEQEETCFVDVVVWGKAAANCRQYLSKGSQVMVEGRLQLDSWEDRNGGGRRTKLRVVAESVQFMNRRRDEGQGNGGYQPNNGYQQNNGYQGSGGYSNGYQSNGFPPANNGYQAPGAGAPPRRQMDAPPMPEPDFGGDAGAPPEDDIPF
ncbi:MAG: single-stranded DNA-binding protein [Lentisphaeria bacterium]|nr:single-stranded DNA-binding protein [Lentisphaeria bacterium]MBR2719893.1 single-stranded DNA-binding protein [Lentisphaeria bacterium]